MLLHHCALWLMFWYMIYGLVSQEKVLWEVGLFVCFESKLDKVQNITLWAIVNAMKTMPIKEMAKRGDLESLELQRTFKVLTQRQLGDYLVIGSTSWLLQPKIGWKDRASTIWQGTSGGHRKTFWIHRSVRKTSSSVETGTRKISEPLSPWRYLSAAHWTTDTNTTGGPDSGDACEEIPQADWTHTYMYWQLSRRCCYCVRNGSHGVFVRAPTGQTATQMLNAENDNISKQKPQHSRLQ